jgi:hypothetical protein
MVPYEVLGRYGTSMVAEESFLLVAHKKSPPTWPFVIEVARYTSSIHQRNFVISHATSLRTTKRKTLSTVGDLAFRLHSKSNRSWLPSFLAPPQPRLYDSPSSALFAD